MIECPSCEDAVLLQAMERVRHGDSDAFEVIYYHCVGKVQKLCRCRLRWADRRRPHLRPWRDGWRHLLYMLNERIASVQVKKGRIKNSSSLETKNESCTSREGRTLS